MDYNTLTWELTVPRKTHCIQPKAVIYCRVSEAKQVSEWFGLQGQERVCMQRCANQQPPIEVAKVFLEPGVSWAKTNRKEFNNCLKYLEKENNKAPIITHFVVSEASRISRPDNIVAAFTLEEQIKSFGVEIVKVDSPNINENTHEGTLFKTIQYAIAGYERKQIARRARNGRVNRLMNGFRPFLKPPVGYLRRRISKRDYIDEIDPLKWPMIKEWLEMFANDVLLTQADLWDYWNKKWLRTNAPNAKKLWRTFPEKVLQLHRIFFYAGYVIYPDRGVKEPVEGKHIGLISLSTAHKLIEKLQKAYKGKNRKANIKLWKLSNEHPLRWAIVCTWCWRKFTSWNTNKYVTKGETRYKKVYPYYGCGTLWCPERANVPKAKLEREFEELIKSLKISKSVSKLIDKLFDKRNSNYSSAIERKQKMKYSEFSKGTKRLANLEQTMISTNNLVLHKKLEEEWSVLHSELQEMKIELKNQKDTLHRAKELLSKVRILFEDPYAIWQLGNSTMRELLLIVRFGWELYYTKDRWLRTGEKPTLSSVLSELKTENTVNRDAGSKPRTFWDSRFGKFHDLTFTNADNIQTLRTLITSRDIGFIDSEHNYKLRT